MFDSQERALRAQDRALLREKERELREKERELEEVCTPTLLIFHTFYLFEFFFVGMRRRDQATDTLCNRHTKRTKVSHANWRNCSCIPARAIRMNRLVGWDHHRALIRLPRVLLIPVWAESVSAPVVEVPVEVPVVEARLHPLRGLLRVPSALVGVASSVQVGEPVEGMAALELDAEALAA